MPDGVLLRWAAAGLAGGVARSDRGQGLLGLTGRQVLLRATWDQLEPVARRQVTRLLVEALFAQGSPMRIIWLYGPPGVGKSTTAWEALNALADSGEATAYVDIDQLGMLYPGPTGDPYAERVAGRALGAVAGEYERLGAETLVVSGVLDPDLAPFQGDVLASFPLDFVRLAVDETELKRRMDTRRGGAEVWEEVLEEVRAYENARFDHPVVVAAGATPTQVARRVLAAAVAVHPAETAPGPVGDADQHVVTGEGGEAILVGGTRAVGKSSVAWEAFMSLRRQGITTGFLDLRQLGFFGRDGGLVDHRLQAAALKAIWPVFRDAGAEMLLLNGPVDDAEQVEQYRESLGGTPLRWYRLTADQNALAERVGARGQGDGDARLAGDTLTGLSDAEARLVVTEALRAQERAHPASSGSVLDTTHLSVEVAAQRILGEIR
jgi:hypothetical protein